MTQSHISRMGMNRRGDIFISAYDPDTVAGDELPYELSFFVMDGNDWQFLGQYDVDFIDALVEDGATGDMVALSRAGEMLWNLDAAAPVRFAPDVLQVYANGCTTEKGMILAGTNGHILSVEGTAQVLLSGPFVDRSVRIGDVLSVARYAGVEQRVNFSDCAVSPDGQIAAVGARSAVVLGQDGDWVRPGLKEPGANLAQVLWSQGRGAFLMAGGAPGAGVVHTLQPDGTTDLVGRTERPDHLVAAAELPMGTFALSGLTSALYRLDGGRLVQSAEDQTRRLGRGVDLRDRGTGLVAAFTNGLYILDEHGSALLPAPDM